MKRLTQKQINILWREYLWHECRKNDTFLKTYFDEVLTQAQLNSDKKAFPELIEDALAHFCHKECPHCGAGISLEKYIDRTDIAKWLREEK